MSTLERIYAQIPAIKCQRKCHLACGPITVFDVEWKRMKAAAIVPLDKLAPNLTCPALVANSCSIYSARPIICRLWGAVRVMACPFGCEPERWLTDLEAYALMQQVDELSHGKTAGPK